MQGSCLKLSLNFVLYGFVAIRRDRTQGLGGGCVTFVKEGFPYTVVGSGGDKECCGEGLS